MPTVAEASTQNVKRLLELFPISRLRAVWPAIKGSKEEVCQAIAEAKEPDQVVAFVNEHFSCCRQHVHVFDRPAGGFALPARLAEATAEVLAAGEDALYVVRSEYKVVLKDPLEEATLEFLWPIRIEMTDAHLIVRFVVLEKDLGAYFDRPYLLNNRGSDEKDIVNGLASGYSLTPADLHRGVKKLWVDGFMDAPKTKYKKAKSTAAEAMDEELGIKEHNPELYAQLLESVMFATMFKVDSARALTVEVFSVDPSTGYIAFPRYADNAGDTDVVIREILTNNQ